MGGGTGPRLPIAQGDASHSREPAPSCPAAGGRGGKRVVRRVSYLPPHLRVHAVRGREERQAGSDRSSATLPSFTVDTYVHLLRDGLGEPLSLSRSLRSAMAPRSRPGSVNSRFWRGTSRLTMRSGLRLRPARGGRRCRQHARTRSRSPARHRAPDAGCAVPL